MIAAATVPIIEGGVSLVLHRRFSVLSVLVGLSLLLSGALVLLGGPPRLILARESLLSGGIGVVLLVSLLWPQPFIYHMARHFFAGNTAGRRMEFNRKAAVPWFRSFLRLLTVVWGLVTVGDAALNTYLALHLPVATFLAVSPLARYGIVGSTLAWTLAHAHRGRYLTYLFDT